MKFGGATIKIRDNYDLAKRAIVFSETDLNVLKMFCKESLKHFSCKAILFHYLRHLQHNVITEFEVTGCGVGDVFDINTNAQYEIECSGSPSSWKEKASQYARTGVDVIVIPCVKIPNTLDEIRDYIANYVKPD